MTTPETLLLPSEATDSNDADCLFAILAARDIRKLREATALVERDDHGRPIECELLCKKCPVVVMGKMAMDGEILVRSAKPENCKEGFYSNLDEDWS